MAVYMSDTPWGPDRNGAIWFYLWGDHPDEVVPVLYGVGSDETSRACFTTWDAYQLTPEQFADAVALGVTITDRFGPLRLHYQRTGNKAGLARLAKLTG